MGSRYHYSRCLPSLTHGVIRENPAQLCPGVPEANRTSRDPCLPGCKRSGDRAGKARQRLSLSRPEHISCPGRAPVVRRHAVLPAGQSDPYRIFLHSRVEESKQIVGFESSVPVAPGSENKSGRITSS
jgi:hypothetical protein